MVYHQYWLLVACYIPPLQPVTKYNNFLISTETVMPDFTNFDDIIIAGDFILPGVK